MRALSSGHFVVYFEVIFWGFFSTIISSKPTRCGHGSDGYGRHRPHLASHIHGHSTRQLALPPSSFLSVGVSRRTAATPPPALFTPYQTTLSSHATLVFHSISRDRMNHKWHGEPTSCQAQLLAFEHTPRRVAFISVRNFILIRSPTAVSAERT